MVGKSSTSHGKAPCPQHRVTNATHTRVPSGHGLGVSNNILGRKLAMISSSSSSGKSCVQKHSLLSHDFTCPTPNSADSDNRNRHNVAIATQVINPSAIRGSFHHRPRLVRPFAAEDDEDEENEKCFGTRFGRRRSRCVNWNKLGCYGISIILIVLVMTGVVLAVGYMQSEKQRILTRSAKLAQDRNATIMLMNQLIPDSPILLANANISSTVDESPIFPTTTEITIESENESDTTILNHSEEVQLIEPSHEEPDADSDGDPVTVTEHEEPPEIQILDNPAKNEESMIADILHKSPSEVTILPPKDFSFDEGSGVSFDIPIYNASGKDETSFTFQVIPLTTTSKPAEFSPGEFQIPTVNSIGVDIPVVAKLQTDLFEAGSDSAEDYEQNSPTGSTQTQAQSQSRQKSRSGGSGNPPKVKIPDRSYTPRPSSVNKYKAKPPRPTYKPPSIKFHLNDASSAEYNSGSSGNSNSVGPVSVVVPPPTNFKFDPSPAPAPATAPPYAKFDYSGPVGVTHVTPASSAAVTPYPTNFENFKFDFTTQSSAVTLPSTSVDLRFDFNNFATAHGLDLSGVGSSHATTAATVAPSYVSNQNFEIDYSKLAAGTGSSSGVNHNENSNSIDSQQLSPQASSGIGAIGSASPVGATLNQFYNFDTPAASSNPYLAYGGNSNPYGGGTEDAPRLSPGQIPLDLASSYIQAGPPGKIYNTNNAGAGAGANGDLSSSFSYNDPSLATFNTGGGGSGTPAPNYNTITQGIHLLSLLSGNIPNHLLQGHSDQHSSASSANSHAQLPDYNSKPEYQIAGLTGYGGSSNAFLAGINSNSGAASGNYNPYLISPTSDSQSASSDYTADLYSSKRFPDQEGSFSQNIISKIKAGTGGTDSSSSRSGKSISISPASALGSLSMPKLPPTVEDHGPTLDVLGLRALLNKFIESGSTLKKEVEKAENPVPDQPQQSKPRKSADLDTAASEALLMRASDSPEFGRKLTLKTTSQKKRQWEGQGSSSSEISLGSSSSENERAEKGLKSGFYV